MAANLVDNAWRHNVPGGLAEVTTAAENGRTVPAAANTGLAIPADQVERPVQPFRTLAADRTGGDGFGLGLSIVAEAAFAASAKAAPPG